MRASVDVGACNELVYRSLLCLGEASVAKIAHATGLVTEAVTPALGELAARGLVSRSDAELPHFVAVAPDLAAALPTGDSELSRVLAEVSELSRRHSGADSAPDDTVRVLVGAERIAAQAAEVASAARREVLSLCRLPLGPQMCVRKEAQLLNAGVTVRRLYDHQVLGTPGALRDIHQRVERGAVARLQSDLPTSLVLVDNQAGLLLDAGAGHSRALLVSPGATLDLLTNLFDLLWTSADAMRAGIPNQVTVDHPCRTDGWIC